MAIEDFAMDWLDLRGRTALVTGGNRGIGRALSAALATAGADVFVPGLGDDDGSTRRLVEGHGRRYEFLEVDLGLVGIADRVIATCADRLGPVDILVNNAGICLLGDVLEFGRAEWDAMVAVNLTAAFDLSRAAAPSMVEQGRGKMINICSLFSFLGGRSSPGYAATKHGLAGLTKAYCDELAGHGVQVNGIAPGYVATELTEATRRDPAADRAVIDRIPAGRWGEPLDLMGAVVFLAGRASDYVNGHLLCVDGGYVVR